MIGFRLSELNFANRNHGLVAHAVADVMAGVEETSPYFFRGHVFSFLSSQEFLINRHCLFFKLTGRRRCP